MDGVERAVSRVPAVQPDLASGAGVCRGVPDRES